MPHTPHHSHTLHYTTLHYTTTLTLHMHLTTLHYNTHPTHTLHNTTLHFTLQAPSGMHWKPVLNAHLPFSSRRKKCSLRQKTALRRYLHLLLSVCWFVCLLLCCVYNVQYAYGVSKTVLVVGWTNTWLVCFLFHCSQLLLYSNWHIILILFTTGGRWQWHSIWPAPSLSPCGRWQCRNVSWWC